MARSWYSILNGLSTAILAAAVLCVGGPLLASEAELIGLAKEHLKRGEYYSAITESMRYQHLHPGGAFYPRSLLIMGEAYYRGGNYYEGTTVMAECFTRFKTRKEGEEALISLGYMRLQKGSAFYAGRTYQEYNYLYREGAYREEAAGDICYAAALQFDIGASKKAIGAYREAYPEGKYLEKVRELNDLIDREINRPKKSLGIAVAGSLLLPGFGHFYTENYGEGFLSLATNAALVFLIYDGYRDDNKFRMAFFSLMEFSFYQYSLFGAVRDVYEYNSRDSFYESVRLSIRRHF